MNVKLMLLEEDKRYQGEDVLGMLPDYFEMDFKQLNDFFSGYQVIGEEKVIQYVTWHQDAMWENRFKRQENLEQMIKMRLQDYYILRENLAVLSHKALNYLFLLEKIANSRDERLEEFDQKLFRQVEIFPWYGELDGYDFNRILIPLFHITTQFLNLLHQINHLETYHRKVYPNTFLSSYDEVYVGDFVIENEQFNWDKTSLRGSFKRRILKK